MKAAPALRKAREAGTLRMLAEARECIGRIAAASPQLSVNTKYAVQQLAPLAQARVITLEALPPHASETWIAVANLAGALERIEAVTNAPEEWAGTALLFEAQHLLGAADVQSTDAARLAAQRSKGGSVTVPGSKAEQIRIVDDARPGATSGQIAAAVDADPRHVRRVRSGRKR